MNNGLKNKLIAGVGTNNISYIMQEKNDFSVTEYKVMQNQKGLGLLKCAKVMYNGKIKLVYLIEDYMPLSQVAMRLGVSESNAVIFNLIQSVINIKANGFFHSENLELDFDKIFVDTKDNSVHLVYFPLNAGLTGKLSEFENEFRVALINLFNSFPVFSAPQFQRLCSDLSNGALTLEMVLKKLQDNINNGFVPSGAPTPQPVQQFQQVQQGQQVQQYQQVQQPQPQPYTPPQDGFPGPNVSPQFAQPVMTITSINSPVQLTLTVDKPEYSIGKNPNMVDGVITYNPAISRVHCKILFMSGKYYISDEGSANGTYVNSQKVVSQQLFALNNGDYLRVANSDFIVNF